MKKYMTEKGSDARITEVEVERESESSVWIDGRRCRRLSDFRSYYDSWADAHVALLTEAEDAAAAARRSLERANSTLGNVKGMKAPGVAVDLGESL